MHGDKIKPRVHVTEEQDRVAAKCTSVASALADTRFCTSVTFTRGEFYLKHKVPCCYVCIDTAADELCFLVNASCIDDVH